MQKRASLQEWIAIGKQRKKLYFFYDQIVYDLTQFVNLHPGGSRAMQPYAFKDITNVLFTVFPHKKSQTLNKIERYIIGVVDEGATKKERESKSVKKSKKNQSIKKQTLRNKENKYSTKFTESVAILGEEGSTTNVVKLPDKTEACKKLKKHDKFDISIKSLESRSIVLDPLFVNEQNCSEDGEQVEQQRTIPVFQIKFLSR